LSTGVLRAPLQRFDALRGHAIQELGSQFPITAALIRQVIPAFLVICLMLAVQDSARNVPS
jgi:hypothetical protein